MYFKCGLSVSVKPSWLQYCSLGTMLIRSGILFSSFCQGLFVRLGALPERFFFMARVKIICWNLNNKYSTIAHFHIISIVTVHVCSPIQTPRWHIDLEPWASESQSLEDEAKRFLSYITTQQVSCASLRGKKADQEGSTGAWAVCLDPDYKLIHRIESRHCRVYSFGLGVDDRSLENSLAQSGCEVHCFDPSLKQPHLQQAEMWLHRLSVDWRDPSPAVVAQRQYASTKKLATILNDFGHREVDVLKADMESAEWKILENLILERVLDSVGQLLLELHLHWAGFEVGGDEPSVVRYWYSLLKELERSGFHLFHIHSDPAKPHIFLQKNVLNASSAYTLSWVNTQWRPLGKPDRTQK
uniref:Methyltransferase like 24 n=1 Tax=Neolamprologus brichardi TaxID=32507 RepID=A0A3Q4HF41_NEOBR